MSAVDEHQLGLHQYKKTPAVDMTPGFLFIDHHAASKYPT